PADWHGRVTPPVPREGGAAPGGGGGGQDSCGRVGAAVTSWSGTACPERISSIRPMTLDRRSPGTSSCPQQRLTSFFTACSSPYFSRQGEHTSKWCSNFTQSASGISRSRNS